VGFLREGSPPTRNDVTDDESVEEKMDERKNPESIYTVLTLMKKTMEGPGDVSQR
jgi:hypothetical protein